MKIANFSRKMRIFGKIGEIAEKSKLSLRFFGKFAAKNHNFFIGSLSVDQSKAAKIPNCRENREFFAKIANFRKNRQKICRENREFPANL